MTQYYEPEARRLEEEANRRNDPAEQNRLWAEAARIGTPVELDEDGEEIWPNPNRPVETCARCGHQTRGCPHCGKNDPFLGSSVNGATFCHTFSETRPTCYMLESWSTTRAVKRLLATADDIGRVQTRINEFGQQKGNRE